jgi:hypothetical protein
MGFFKKKQPDTPETRAVQTLADFANSFIADYEDFDASGDRFFAFYAYIFGAALALAKRAGLTPPQVHAVAIAFFVQRGKQPLEVGAEMAGFFVSEMSGQSPWSQAFDGGIEDFNSWQAAPDRFKLRRLRAVLDAAPAGPM